MADFTLRCNNLSCRLLLHKQAVVTTCSHIFCVSCADPLINPPPRRSGTGGASQFQPLTCPACEVQLSGPDDVVLTLLNPTEEYKTSVLSGLSPNIIMEIAGKGLSFWAYQASMEIQYQEAYVKNMTEQFTNASNTLDLFIHEANTEISSLREKIASLSEEQERLSRKNQELSDAYRDKCRKALQIQELYDKLKRKAIMGQIQVAASHDVEGAAMGVHQHGDAGDSNRRRRADAHSNGSEGDNNDDFLRNGISGINIHGAHGTPAEHHPNRIDAVVDAPIPRGFRFSNSTSMPTAGTFTVENRGNPTPGPSMTGPQGFSTPHRQQLNVSPAAGSVHHSYRNNSSFMNLVNSNREYHQPNLRAPLGSMANSLPVRANAGGHIGGLSGNARIGRQVFAGGGGHGHQAGYTGTTPRINRPVIGGNPIDLTGGGISKGSGGRRMG